MIAQLGYPERALASAYGLSYDTDGVPYINQQTLKLLVYAGSATVLFWLLTASHVPTTDELKVLAMAVSFWLYYSVVGLGFYIALEPYVRRRWPTRLITWSRVLAGKFTDPLVGRDVLIGIILGMWVGLASRSRIWQRSDRILMLSCTNYSACGL